MSTERPTNVDEMIAWLRAHPDEPFRTQWSKDRLLAGTRNDTGEIVAWDCTVTASRFEFDRRPAGPPCSKGEGAATSGDVYLDDGQGWRKRP